MMDSSLEDMTSLLPKVSDIDTSDVPDAVDWREKSKFMCEMSKFWREENMYLRKKVI